MRSEDYTEELREKHSKIQTRLWQDPEYRKMQSISHSKRTGPRVKYVDKVCLYCGDVFAVAPWENYRKFCSSFCYGKYISIFYVGARASNWRGGLSFVGYPEDFSEELKVLVRERDNNTCQLCGRTKEEEGRDLCVHHIDYDKENCNPRNLTTLCCRCNPKVNFSRSFWSEMFVSSVRKNLNKRIIDLDYMILRKPRCGPCGRKLTKLTRER